MKRARWMSNLSLISQLGISMITPILLCTFIGSYIDKMADKSPLFTIILMLLGVGGAFRNLFHIVNKQVRKNQKEDKHV